MICFFIRSSLHLNFRTRKALLVYRFQAKETKLRLPLLLTAIGPEAACALRAEKLLVRTRVSGEYQLLHCCGSNAGYKERDKVIASLDRLLEGDYSRDTKSDAGVFFHSI